MLEIRLHASPKVAGPVQPEEPAIPQVGEDLDERDAWVPSVGMHPLKLAQAFVASLTSPASRQRLRCEGGPGDQLRLHLIQLLPRLPFPELLHRPPGLELFLLRP